MIRRIFAIVLAMLTLTSLVACGGSSSVSDTTEPATEPPTEPVTTEPVTEAPGVEAVDPLDAFTKIWTAMPEDFRFAAAGGDYENMVMDGPGAFGLTAAEAGENINAMLGFPADLVGEGKSFTFTEKEGGDFVIDKDTGLYRNVDVNNPDDVAAYADATRYAISYDATTIQSVVSEYVEAHNYFYYSSFELYAGNIMSK